MHDEWGGGRGAIDYAALTHAGRISELLELQCERAQLDAAEQRLLACIAADPTDDPDPVRREVMQAKRYACEEVSAVLRIAPQTGRARMELAESLVHRLPDTLAAVEGGDLPLFFARRLASEVGLLPDEAAAQVEAKVLAKATEQSYGAFSRSLRRAVLAADPRGADERFESAHSERRVCDTPDGNGMGWSSAYLPTTSAKRCGTGSPTPPNAPSATSSPTTTGRWTSAEPTP